MTLNEYAKQIIDYLCNKIPDINPATIQEIAEFFVMKSDNFAKDEIAKNNKSWYKELGKRDEQWKWVIKAFEKTKKEW